MTYHISITHSDLQAYADGQLTPDRKREVEAHLKEHAKDAAIVEEYRQLNKDMHAIYDPVLTEQIPSQLSVQPRTKLRWRVAASVAWLMLGIAIGWQLQPTRLLLTENDNVFKKHLIQPAAFAHSIYSPEIRHPVEVMANEQKHLVAWLSKRLKSKIQAPDLTKRGYELVGGRLLPSIDRMAAQLMYQREDGNRITLYIRNGVWDNQVTAFQYSRYDGIGVLYWIDGPLGYAVLGSVDKEELFKLSEHIYQQLN